MTSVSGREIVSSNSFLIPNDTEASFDVLVGATVLKVGVTFRSGTSAEQRNGTWANEGGKVRFSFDGWNNPLGTCTLEPTKFGDMGSQRLYFQLAHHYIGEQKLVHFFVSIGA